MTENTNPERPGRVGGIHWATRTPAGGCAIEEGTPVRRRRFTAAGLAALFIVAGCSETVSPLTPTAVSETGAHRVEGSMVLRWSATARDLITEYRSGPPGAARQLAYLGLAQYAAVVAAEGTTPRPRAAVEGAVAGASAALLSYFFPVEAGTLDDVVQEQAPKGPGARRHFADGQALGRAIAVRVIERAQADGYNLPFTGTIPVGPGYWTSSTPPVLPRLGEMRPFFLSSGSQHRPAPPPEFGSPAYQAALDEVRQVALNRTPEQIDIANFWSFPAGTYFPPGYWNEVGATLVAEHRLREREAARVLLLLNGAMMDALIAGHDAKYAYWFIRPSQADPSITLSIGLPNHPSYPSTHSSLSKSAAGILGSLFPSERERLEALAEEAGLSRLYAGIHYRFDLEAGGHIAHGLVDTVLAYDREPGLEALIP